MTWKTSCDYCDEDLAVDDPSDAPTWNGGTFHEDCLEKVIDEELPRLPKTIDIEFHREMEHPYHLFESGILSGIDLEYDGSEDPTVWANSRIPREVWNLGHFTRVYFEIDEDWEVTPVELAYGGETYDLVKK